MTPQGCRKSQVAAHLTLKFLPPNFLHPVPCAGVAGELLHLALHHTRQVGGGMKGQSSPLAAPEDGSHLLSSLLCLEPL